MHPEIDRFSDVDSMIQRWDPRWKIVAFTALILAFGIVGEEARRSPDLHRDLPPALAALAVSISLVELSRIPIAFALRGLRPAFLFFALLFIVLPLTRDDGAPVAGPITFSTSGLLVAATISIQASATLLLVFPMFGTSRFDATMRALHELRLPGPLVHLVLFAYRYLFVLAGEVRRMQISWRARGFSRRPNLHSLRTVGNGVGMLLVASLERSQRIHHAMVCRGYAGTFRTLGEQCSRPSDLGKAAVVVALAAAFFLWRRW